MESDQVHSTVGSEQVRRNGDGGYIGKLLKGLERRRALEQQGHEDVSTEVVEELGRLKVTESELTLSSASTTSPHYFSSSSSNSSVTSSGLSNFSLPSNHFIDSTLNVKKWRIGEIISPELSVPGNFSMVEKGLYRSSFPLKENWPFLKKLGLKSVLTLVLEDYPQENLDWLESEGIQFFQFGIPGNKEPFVHIPDERIISALATVLDTRNHPMLIHCNKGKHRTGCLIGCLRKLQSWSSTATFSEYRQFSYPKSRSMDQQFIELFDSSEVWDVVEEEWLPNWGSKQSSRCVNRS